MRALSIGELALAPCSRLTAAFGVKVLTLRAAAFWLSALSEERAKQLEQLVMSEATLEIDEFHPMAPNALEYVKKNTTPKDVESMISCSLSGNRTADICLSTWNRLKSGEPVSDRYLLGLAWFIKELRDNDS